MQVCNLHHFSRSFKNFDSIFKLKNKVSGLCHNLMKQTLLSMSSTSLPLCLEGPRACTHLGKGLKQKGILNSEKHVTQIIHVSKPNWACFPIFSNNEDLELGQLGKFEPELELGLWTWIRQDEKVGWYPWTACFTTHLWKYVRAQSEFSTMAQFTAR